MKSKEIFEQLMEQYYSLCEYKGTALEAKQEGLIKEVVNHYDMIAIGKLYMMGMPIEVDSVYYDRKERKVMLHISSEEMEGDIIFASLQTGMQEEVIKMVVKEMKWFHDMGLDEESTFFDMEIAGHDIKCRSVYVKELDEEVMVTTEEVYSTYIKEGDSTDNQFYCYVPSDQFRYLNDHELESYINENY